MQNQTVVGAVLKVLCECEGLSSNRQIAKRVGCSHTTVGDLFNGNRKLTPEMASRLEQAHLGSAAEWTKLSTIDEARTHVKTDDGNKKVEVTVKYKGWFWKNAIASTIASLFVAWLLAVLS